MCGTDFLLQIDELICSRKSKEAFKEDEVVKLRQKHYQDGDA